MSMNMEAFNTSNWIKTADKEQALQNIENSYATQQGRPPCRIVATDMEDSRMTGKYVNEEKVIYINKALLTSQWEDRFNAVDTVIHEGRHAYQHYAVEHPGFHPNEIEVTKWKEDFACYIKSDKAPPYMYRFQAVERDAFEFAESEMEKSFGNMDGESDFYHAYSKDLNIGKAYLAIQAENKFQTKDYTTAIDNIVAANYQEYLKAKKELEKFNLTTEKKPYAEPENNRMNDRPEAFTYSDITYSLPVELTSLLTLKIVQTIGEHIELTLTGIAPDTLEPKDIEEIAPKARIEIKLPGLDQPFFAGVCTTISMTYQAGLKTVEIKGCSWTHELDITKNSRSYQKLDISYNELVADILKDYPEKDFRINLPEGKNYTTFAVQYWETEWEFLKRIAAREGTVLVAEYQDANHQPRFWLGLPNAPAKPLPVTTDKRARRDIEAYLAGVNNQMVDVKETDFITYEDFGYEILSLGQAVNYNENELIITTIISQIEKGLLRNSYTLAFSEKLALAPIENDNLRSVALSGKVLTSSNIHSKIHLDIDEEQDEATAIWFPYAAATNNFVYCMPHNGEDIDLYFRDGWEQKAIAVSGARKNGGGCKKTADYNNRYFTNHERKELFLSPDTVSFTADESAANKITIKMSDQFGILIDSKKDIGIGADINLKLTAEKDISLEGMMGAYFLCGDGSIILKEEADIFGPAKVQIDGSGKSAFPDLEQTEESVEEQIDNFREEHPIIMAVAGLVPIVGSVIDAYDAYQCFKEGDTVGGMLNLGSAAIGLIPGGKVLTTGGRILAEGGMAAASYAHAKQVF